MSLTVLIAEDDPAMRQVLRNAVKDVPGVEVVGETEDGITALQMYEELRPKVVLIDIDLPRRNGLDLAQDIFDINPWTYIIFCTGFSEYRDRAFEIYAFDYLVKPFRLDRITQTINRIITVEAARKNDTRRAEVQHKQKGVVKGARLFRDGEKFLMVDLKDIIFITRENRRTTVHYIGGKVTTEETMQALEEQLKGQMFYRSHKGFLINVNMIKEMIPCGKSTYQVVMANTRERPLMTWDKLRDLESVIKSEKGLNRQQ
jgi:two-component system LytT family response regulator